METAFLADAAELGEEIPSGSLKGKNLRYDFPRRYDETLFVRGVRCPICKTHLVESVRAIVNNVHGHEYAYETYQHARDCNAKCFGVYDLDWRTGKILELTPLTKDSADATAEGHIRRAWASEFGGPYIAFECRCRGLILAPEDDGRLHAPGMEGVGPLVGHEEPLARPVQTAPKRKPKKS